MAKEPEKQTRTGYVGDELAKVDKSKRPTPTPTPKPSDKKK
jgi:hypothetical protein